MYCPVDTAYVIPVCSDLLRVVGRLAAVHEVVQFIACLDERRCNRSLSFEAVHSWRFRTGRRGWCNGVGERRERGDGERLDEEERDGAQGALDDDQAADARRASCLARAACCCTHARARAASVLRMCGCVSRAVSHSSGYLQSALH